MAPVTPANIQNVTRIVLEKAVVLPKNPVDTSNTVTAFVKKVQYRRFFTVLV